MSEITRNFIKAALIYLAIGVTLGLIMAIGYDWGLVPFLTPAHAHINLLGWVSMLMFGVAYHIIPRFHGRMLHSDRLAVVHFWLANVGVVGLALSMPYKFIPGMALAGSAYAAAAYIFVYNIWRTMQGSPQVPAGR